MTGFCSIGGKQLYFFKWYCFNYYKSIVQGVQTKYIFLSGLVLCFDNTCGAYTTRITFSFAKKLLWF